MQIVIRNEFSAYKNVQTETDVNFENGVTFGNAIELNIEIEIFLKKKTLEGANEIEIKIVIEIVVTKKNVIFEFVSLDLKSLIS